MLLDSVVRASAAVAASPGRLAKIEEIARLLREVPPAEIPVAVAFLAGDLTQRQIGVGYAALTDLLGDGSGTDEPEAATPVLSLAETDQTLGQIGAQAGAGSQAERRRLLAALMRRATPTERQFLVRLLAGDLRQGALDGVMTEAIARAAAVPVAGVRRAYQLTGSLADAAAAALSPAGPAVALGEVALHVGRPVKPMLASSAPTVAAAMDRISPAAVEWKIDGIRVQVHRRGDEVRVFTRTLDDITHRVPEVAAAIRALAVSTAVMDGEAIALRPDGRPYPFQVTSARAASQARPDSRDNAASPDGARRAVAPGQIPLTVFLFDALYLDGADLIDSPASERFARLAGVAPELRIPRIVTADADEAAAFFADAVQRGHEGVVVKAVDAPYGAGRRGGDWIKVKPRHTLDLVVLAAEWGHGRRQGWLSNLHLGARDPATGGMVMLGKTFKGLTDALLGWQTERLLELAVPEHAEPGHPQRGVVRVRPELVVEIAFDGVQASSRYPGGVTLRFARVLRYRPDKSAVEADTIDSVRALWSGEL
jgi:ATP-dependent DNA ligase I